MTTVEQERQTLGDRYELQQLIATGGMGQVWQGRDLLLERSVAVKVLRSEYADDPTFLARFRNEARHAAALSHPNIATVLDYGEGSDGGTGEHLAYLVMELVEGAPLSTRIRDDGPLDLQEALSVLRQAAAGLAEAHRAGVVHRDVKPSNILVRPDGRVKLTDFGIAWSAECVPLTQTGQVIGTAQYMSPEQAAGERVSPASDVYALGLVGYESLTGHAAFSGTNPVTVALKQVREQPEPLPDDLPPDVRELIGSALTKDPGARLPDGEAFLHAVEGTLDHQSGPVPPTAPVAVAAAALPAAAAPGGPARAVPGSVAPGTVADGAPRRAARRAPAHSPRQGDRRRLLVLLPLLALLLVAGGIAFVSTRSGDAPAAEAAGTAPAGIVLTAADHVGRPVTEVLDDLTALGLTTGQRSQASADADPGTVVRLSPVDVELAPGDRVEVVVAVPPDTAVPAPEPSAPGAPGTGAEGEAAPAPDPATTEATAPDTSAPDTSAPDTSAPDTSAPDTSAPDPVAPDTADAGGTAPADGGTPTPDGTAGTVPGSAPGGSTAPGSAAPGSSGSSSTAPEDTATGAPTPTGTQGDATGGTTGETGGVPEDVPEGAAGATPEGTGTAPPATGTGGETTPPATGTADPATPSSDTGTTPDREDSAPTSVPAGDPAPAGASG
ncbi:serine/threonine protein kinase [Geodermatophilus amargosae]|uniref:serine/threonine protein kinase n=1 Tax=Geodermatophilus amargosae TaxID=1296565 RepID=UPI0034DF4003